jgi:hypothetical protein
MSKSYIPKYYHGGDFYNQLENNYNKFNAYQKRKYPTFQAYKAFIDKQELNRLASNKIGEEKNRLGSIEAEQNNEIYNEYIAENPQEEIRRIKGKLIKKSDYDIQKEKDFLEWEKKNHPANSNFFRPAVQALTDVADNFNHIIPEPMQELYKNFAPPTSKYYKDNILKSLGSGFALKELREHAKTLNIKDHHKLKRKELINELHGRGYFNWIPIVKDKIKSYFNKIPKPVKDVVKAMMDYSKNIDKFNSKSKKTLEQYGNEEITNIKIFRQEIDGVLGKVISFITATDGKLYHLGMLLTLQSGKVITLEKNHTINIVEGSTIKPKDDVIEVNLKEKHITLNGLMDKAIETVGKNQIFEYDAFGGKNCQNFVIDVLKSNGILSKEDQDFTLQDLSEHKKNSRLGEETGDIIKGITDTRNAVNNLTGFGVKKSVKYRLRK